jgi:hypothetical protein
MDTLKLELWPICGALRGLSDEVMTAGRWPVERWRVPGDTEGKTEACLCLFHV